MSFEAHLWAMHDAPVATQSEWAVLLVLGDAADADGCNAFRSGPTIARIAKCDEKTVTRRFKDLADRGLIRKGDQRRVEHIPAGQRPIVWDLQIPHSWFGSKIGRINEDRASRFERRPEDRRPITPEMRPDLDPAPEKKKRIDAGVSRPKKPTMDDRLDEIEAERGGTTSHPSADSDNYDNEGGLQVTGDSQSPEGGLQVQGGGTTSHPTLSFDPVLDSLASAREPEPVETQKASQPEPEPEDEPQRDLDLAEKVLTLAFQRAKVPSSRQPKRGSRTKLLNMLADLLDIGWTPDQLVVELDDDRPITLRDNVFGIMRHRIGEVGEPPSADVIVLTPNQRTSPEVCPDAACDSHSGGVGNVEWAEGKWRPCEGCRPNAYVSWLERRAREAA